MLTNIEKLAIRFAYNYVNLPVNVNEPELLWKDVLKKLKPYKQNELLDILDDLNVLLAPFEEQIEDSEVWFSELEILKDQVKELIHLINQKGDVRGTLAFKEMSQKMEIYS